VSSRQFTYVVEFLAMLLTWGTVVVTYHVMTGGRWRKSIEGKHVMTLGVIFVWLSALILANLVFRDYPGRWLIGTASYSLPTIYGLWRLAMIVRAQRGKRRFDAARTFSTDSSRASSPPR
jgi:hypothetical protein